MPIGQDFIVTIDRTAVGQTTGYVNGVLQWSFTDSGLDALPSGNRLTFFADDFDTSQNEAFAGSVDYIRIYSHSSPVPEPSSIALFGIGAFGLLGYGRRRKRKLAA